MAHTPGPWIADGQDIIASTPHRLRVAWVEKYDSGDLASQWDARLIAAAPDMLAELERLLDVLGEEDIAIVEGVIAKARGE